MNINFGTHCSITAFEASWFEWIITLYYSSDQPWKHLHLPCEELTSLIFTLCAPDSGAGQGGKADPLQGQLGRRGDRFETLYRWNESCQDYWRATAVHQMPCANRARHRCEYQFGFNLEDGLRKREGDGRIKKTIRSGLRTDQLPRYVWIALNVIYIHTY